MMLRFHDKARSIFYRSTKKVFYSQVARFTSRPGGKGPERFRGSIKGQGIHKYVVPWSKRTQGPVGPRT